MEAHQVGGHAVRALQGPVEPPAQSQPLNEMSLKVERKESCLSVELTADQFYIEYKRTFPHLKIFVGIN